MPGQPRPNKDAAKIAYKLLKTPKDMQQIPDRKPSAKREREWFVDSSTAQ